MILYSLNQRLSVILHTMQFYSITLTYIAKPYSKTICSGYAHKLKVPNVFIVHNEATAHYQEIVKYKYYLV